MHQKHLRQASIYIHNAYIHSRFSYIIQPGLLYYTVIRLVNFYSRITHESCIRISHFLCIIRNQISPVQVKTHRSGHQSSRISVSLKRLSKTTEKYTHRHRGECSKLTSFTALYFDRKLRAVQSNDEDPGSLSLYIYIPIYI